VDSRFSLALKYYDAKLNSEAWALVRELLVDPAAATDVLGFATALRLEARAFGEVVELSDRILARDRANIGAWLFKTQALIHMGRNEESQAALRAAAALQEPHPRGWNNLGNVLDEHGRPDDARAAFARAIAEAPDFSMAHNNLGATLAGQGQFAAAAAAYRAALRCDAGNLAALNNLGVALLEQGLVAEAAASFDAVLAADPGHRDAADNRLYAALYTEEDPRAVRAAHVAWGKSHPAVPPLRPSHAGPARRLRIGYVSPDLRYHSVSFFVEALLAAHDPVNFEVFCYADVIRPDPVTTRFKALVPQWRDICGCSDDDVFKLIRGDQIDVLVDLAGHTKGNRLGVFARRAAPVQVTAIGYPATTGLPAMDYRFCDAVTDPAPEADDFVAEALVRLGGLHCYMPPQKVPDVGPLPALTADHITFGAFNKLAKISPKTVALWSGVLKVVPGSRLLIKTKPLTETETREGLARTFAAHGIQPGRLELRGWAAGDRAHLNLYNRVDIALDTYPYNGTTTTCEALWMGVPVLTLAGRGHASRVGASLLAQVDMKDWIVATESQFAVQAAALAGDMPALAKLRQGLRRAVAASPLCDGAAYARAVETAYRAMWRKVCEGGSAQ
jgi:protein O-GlcNAc transferase